MDRHRPWLFARFRLTLLALVALFMAGTAIDVDAGFSYQLRGRVLESGGVIVATNIFTFTLGRSNVCSKGTDWSDWIHSSCASDNVDPTIARLSVRGGKYPCKIQIETQIDGQEGIRTSGGELYGPDLGLLLWKWQGNANVATMAEFNRMSWNPLPASNPAVRIRDFPIADRFIAGDHDRINLKEGVGGLARAGFPVIMVDGSALGRECLLQNGVHRTADAVYCPPGGAFDYVLPDSKGAQTKWAQDILKPLTNAGFARTDLALLAMADESGWYYPDEFRRMTNSPAALTRFHDYLKGQGLSPADVGARAWANVLPKGRGQAVDLPSRRLFYWSMRFFPWDSTRYFAECTRTLESTFYTNMPIFVNWNFFSGRFYVPGPVANNRDRQSSDAAMGGHDWFEFGRMRGSTMLWTEDWFGDELSYQWSYYCARLWSAARLGGVEFGGYIIPRKAGSREDGLLQKAAAIVGHGGKGIQYFVFGPEYLFPGNCYSRSRLHLPRMAEAHRLIAIAEPLLWPGRPRPAAVAILMPRSAQPWDPNGISDATNVRLNSSTVDYMAEVYNLYLAFMHANIPVDFVEEDQLTVGGLNGIKALYITEPNVPAENQKELIKWVSAGGTLVTVSGAAQRDRYNEPCAILRKGTGIAEKERDRLMVPNLYALHGVGSITGACVQTFAIGVRGTLENEKGLTVRARFEDGSAAFVEKNLGKGRAVHFNWMPGMTYGQTPQNRNGMLVNWPAEHREVILAPAREAGVRAAVRPDRPMVEAPLLESTAGAVVTLLNWTGDPMDSLSVEMDRQAPVKSVESAAHGKLTFEQRNGILKWSVPLKGADFIMILP